MEIDYDYLRTGTAIGFRASRELCSNYLFLARCCVVAVCSICRYCLSGLMTKTCSLPSLRQWRVLYDAMRKNWKIFGLALR